MSLEELDKLERQRRDADQRYNDALTAFDASLVRATLPQGAGSSPIPLRHRRSPTGGTGRWGRSSNG